VLAHVCSLEGQLAKSRAQIIARSCAAMRCGLLLLFVLAWLGCRDDVVPAARAEQSARVVALGRMVFFDRALSADGRVSCATCHRPDHAFSDGLVRAVGAGGQEGTRNTPSLLDVARQRSLFWDGRRGRLEDQVLDPLLNPVEHGLADEAQLLARVRVDPRYAAAVRAAYSAAVEQVTVAQLGTAVAAFERTLVSGRSPFDRFLAGQRDAIPEAARMGWVVFDQVAHCTACHVVASAGGEPPLLTDHQFHTVTVGLRRIERKLPELTQRLVRLRGADGAPGRGVLNDPDVAELGRFAVTLDPHDLAAFKTPSLRNVALTAPYMHDGSVATLAAAVELEVYGRGAHDRPMILTPAERDAVVAFLAALTSDGT